MLAGEDADPDTLPWSALRYHHTEALRQLLAERYAPATANRHLAALRGVLKVAHRLGQMSAEDYQSAAAVEGIKGTRLPAGRALQPGELRALFIACAADTNRAAGARDAALLAVLYGAGLRRGEAVALDLDDYDRETGQMLVRAGKGNRDRLVYASTGSREALEAWLQVRGLGAGPLFCPVNKGGRVVMRRMTPPAVRRRTQVRATDASLKAFTPHDLRRTFVGDLLDAGADIVTVQHLAGHSTIATTSRYDRRGEVAKERAAQLLHVPYVAREVMLRSLAGTRARTRLH